MAEQSRESLEKIVKASQQCMDMVHSIATASEEQSAAIEEVSTSMEQISNTFGTTRDSVAQINESMNDFAKIASDLKTIVSWFKTHSRETGHSQVNSVIDAQQDNKLAKSL